jgi:hypothetical protein
MRVINPGFLTIVVLCIDKSGTGPQLQLELQTVHGKTNYIRTVDSVSYPYFRRSP